MKDTPFIKSTYYLGIKAVPNFVFLTEERISYYEKNLRMIPIALIRGFCYSRKVILPHKKELTGRWAIRAYNLGLKVVSNFEELPAEVISYYEKHLDEIPSAIIRGFSMEPKVFFPVWFERLKKSIKLKLGAELFLVSNVKILNSCDYIGVIDKNRIRIGHGCSKTFENISYYDDKNFRSREKGLSYSCDLILLNWSKDMGDLSMANKWAIDNGLAQSTACEVFAVAQKKLYLRQEMGLRRAVITQTKYCIDKFGEPHLCAVFFEEENTSVAIPVHQTNFFSKDIFYCYRIIHP